MKDDLVFKMNCAIRMIAGEVVVLPSRNATETIASL